MPRLVSTYERHHANTVRLGDPFVALSPKGAAAKDSLVTWGLGNWAPESFQAALNASYLSPASQKALSNSLSGLSGVRGVLTFQRSSSSTCIQ